MAKALPSWSALEKHELFPQVKSDDVSRLNFLTHLNMHLAGNVLPGVKIAYENKVLPEFINEHGREPSDRHEVRVAMDDNSYLQMWSAMRRNTMEMRHQLGRSIVLNDSKNITQKVKGLIGDGRNIKLDDDIAVPYNVSAVDVHCQPGCYYTEYFNDDVTVASSYDIGIFVTTAGLLGGLSDGGGQGLGTWLAKEHPTFKPKRILDIGCTIGHNAVPLAQAFPDAEVIAIDVAKPSLRYAAARAKALGVHNITFMQVDAENMAGFADESFDLVTTAMFWHEACDRSMMSILTGINRVLKTGGLTISLEQPQYTDKPVYEQFIRDWDTLNNNEPYWGRMHERDLVQWHTDCGFDGSKMFETGVVSKVDENIFGKADSNSEDFGRAPVWNAFGIWK
ncbi:class I SAM-dependent methyltransferase [Thalassotalea psychrophila]|uniref:Class I SAM-dependent methyltransferase n=1 Tax=Thalassotalea psychrophila TaxID=3065647 RepID=A0ABY9TWP1_9GAMM|nr:class I SAM-dependent methyltransferase [Colwelliaceae bacterium SQ149]